jgi:MYXO-CTERM domain-containing protein
VCGAGGFVCSWASSNHVCVPWDGTDEGHCNGPNDCVCPGQKCDLSQQCAPRDSTFLTSSSTGTTGSPDAGGSSGGGGCGCTAQGGGPDLSPIFGLMAILGVVRSFRRSLRRANTRDS